MNNEIRELSLQELDEVNGAGPGDTLIAIGDAVTNIGNTLLGAVSDVIGNVGNLLTGVINNINQ